MGSINVCEVFVSFQGEGGYLGYPSIFVRTSGCNLRCKWGDTLCDTTYASWDAEVNIQPVSDVIEKVRKLREVHPFVRHVVVTGGEPFVQENLGELLNGLKALDTVITVESNGTQSPSTDLPIDLISLSPKLSTSTPVGTEHEQRHRDQRVNSDYIKQWIEAYDYQLKFVVFQPSDEQEILDLLEQLGGVVPERVFLMPEGINMNQLREHAGDCFEIARRNGWRYTPRAHIEIFGHSRGT